MDWQLYWTILLQALLGTFVLRVIVLPWEYWLYTKKMAELEAAIARRGERIDL
jgi:hypothetical protein